MTQLGFKHTVAKILFWVVVIPLILIADSIADGYSPPFSADQGLISLLASFCGAGVAYGIATAVDAATDRGKPLGSGKRRDHDPD